MAKTRTVYRNVRSRVRRPKRNDLKNYGKKLAIGAAAGLLIAIPLTYAAKRYNKPELMEAGQRGGAVAAAKFGGPIGEIGFQVIDAIADRFILSNGSSYSGTQGQAYL